MNSQKYTNPNTNSNTNNYKNATNKHILEPPSLNILLQILWIAILAHTLSEEMVTQEKKQAFAKARQHVFQHFARHMS